MAIPKSAAIFALIFGPVFAACTDDPVESGSDAGVIFPDATVDDAGDGGHGDPPLPPLTDVCPRGNFEPVIGDSNGDGISDLADAIALQNYLFRGGREPVCRAAADFDGDTRVEHDDAERVLTRQLTLQQVPFELRARACETATPWPEGQCAPLAFNLVGPRKLDDNAFTVSLVLRSPMLAVQGYAIGLQASDCEITRVTPEGTVAAEVWDDPPGIRHLGWATTPLVQGGAVAYLLLSLSDDVYFPQSLDPTPVLTIHARATAPESGCRKCIISATDGLSWIGEPIETLIAADGRAYVPALPSYEVDVCAE